MSPVSSSLSLPDKLEDGGSWYFSRKELDENSPSRRDGIDLKKEAYLRKSYCTFLQDLGMKLKVPQVTIATAIIFCHRYYLRQSHAKNDGKTIATACMFLAGKVEETPRPLKDVILVSFEIMNKKDPAAIQKIKQKEVYEQQKELILLAERVVLATLAFDLNVQHPYKPLVEAIKKFKVAQNALAQVAWNFVNDGLRTSLCLQFRPHHIAAGAIFLAAKFLKVKLPSDGEKVWWQEFDVTPRQLEEVSNQMLELYEQNKVPSSQANEADGSTVGGTADKSTAKASKEEQGGHANSSLTEGPSGSGTLKPTPMCPEPVDSHSGGRPRSSQNHSSDHGSSVVDASYNKGGGECKVSGYSPHHDNMEEVHDMTSGSNRHDTEDHKEIGNGSSRAREGTVPKDTYRNHNMEGKESVAVKPAPEVIKKFDEDKLKQLREKRRKSRGDTVRRVDTIDEYDPIVKELEEGVELAAAAENEKSKLERRQLLSQSPSRSRNENSRPGKHADAVGLHHFVTKGHVHELDAENVEEGEVPAFENSNIGPQSTDRKRKAESPIENTNEGKKWRDYDEDRSKLGRHAYADREHKRHVQENHV